MARRSLKLASDRQFLRLKARHLDHRIKAAEHQQRAREVKQQLAEFAPKKSSSSS